MLSLDELREKAEQMRIAPTTCESRAQDSFPAGLAVECQVVFGYYILDFVVPSKLLIVEIDGDSHAPKAQRVHDARRDAFCQQLGMTVLRIPNHLAHTAGALISTYPVVEKAAAKWVKAQRRAHYSHSMAEDKQGITNSQKEALRAERAAAKLLRQQQAAAVMAALPPDASGKTIVCALRSAGVGVTPAQKEAKQRARAKRVAKGQANKAKHEAKVAQRRAAKAALKASGQ